MIQHIHCRKYWQHNWRTLLQFSGWAWKFAYESENFHASVIFFFSVLHPVQFSLEQHLLLCLHNVMTSKIHLCVRIPTLFQETFLKKNHSINHDSNISLSWQEISCLTGLCRQSHEHPAKEPENWKHHQLICESYNCSAWRKKGQKSSRVIVSSRNRSEERVEWHCACWL